MEEMGVPVEVHHHEVATAGQCEIGTKFSTLVQRADWNQILKYCVHNVAHAFGKTATFMPKPLVGDNGSGMHCHQSLFKGKKNAFYDPRNKPYQMSKVALSYIAGLLVHARGFLAITNPTVNSYKRLVPGYEAPTNVAWSERNRSPMVRIPAKRGDGTRCELRDEPLRDDDQGSWRSKHRRYQLHLCHGSKLRHHRALVRGPGLWMEPVQSQALHGELSRLDRDKTRDSCGEIRRTLRDIPRRDPLRRHQMDLLAVRVVEEALSLACFGSAGREYHKGAADDPGCSVTDTISAAHH